VLQGKFSELAEAFEKMDKSGDGKLQIREWHMLTNIYMYIYICIYIYISIRMPTCTHLCRGVLRRAAMMYLCPYTHKFCLLNTYRYTYKQAQKFAELILTEVPFFYQHTCMCTPVQGVPRRVSFHGSMSIHISNID
jgi:hypothetical protein